MLDSTRFNFTHQRTRWISRLTLDNFAGLLLTRKDQFHICFNTLKVWVNLILICHQWLMRYETPTSPPGVEHDHAFTWQVRVVAYDRSQSSIRILQRRLGIKPIQNQNVPIWISKIWRFVSSFHQQKVGKTTWHKTVRTATLSNLSVEAHTADWLSLRLSAW